MALGPWRNSMEVGFELNNPCLGMSVIKYTRTRDAAADVHNRVMIDRH